MLWSTWSLSLQTPRWHLSHGLTALRPPYLHACLPLQIPKPWIIYKDVTRATKDCTMRLFQIATEKKNETMCCPSMFHSKLRKPFKKQHVNLLSEYGCTGPMRSPRPLPRFYDGSGAAANLISPTWNRRIVFLTNLLWIFGENPDISMKSSPLPCMQMPPQRDHLGLNAGKGARNGGVMWMGCSQVAIIHLGNSLTLLRSLSCNWWDCILSNWNFAQSNEAIAP